MAIYLIRGDLVNMYVDAIVANANVNLRMVEGVSRAIFHKAGDLELGRLRSRRINHCSLSSNLSLSIFSYIILSK